MEQYAKAITAAVTTLVLFVFLGEGTKVEAAEAAGALLTTFFIWLVPNGRKGDN